MTEYKISIIVNGSDQASPALQSVGRSLSGISEAGKVAAGVLGGSLMINAVHQVEDLGRAALDSVAYYERLGMSLTSMAAAEALNSGAASSMNEALKQTSGVAEETTAWMRNLAIESPFAMRGVAEAYRTAETYGFVGKEAKNLTQTLIDYASGTGQTEEAMKRIALALGQIQNNGKLAGQEVLQLAGAGIPVTKILAKAFGITTGELVKLQEKGLVPADKAIRALTDYMNTSYAGAAKAQAGTFSGMISSISELKEMNLQEFFTGTFEAVRPYMLEFVETMKDPETVANIRAIGNEFGATTTKIIEGVSDTVSWYGQLDTGMQNFLGTLATVALVGPTAVKVFQGIAVFKVSSLFSLRLQA